jgi:hypothetical protein
MSDHRTLIDQLTVSKWTGIIITTVQSTIATIPQRASPTAGSIHLMDREDNATNVISFYKKKYKSIYFQRQKTFTAMNDNDIKRLLSN